MADLKAIRARRAASRTVPPWCKCQPRTGASECPRVDECQEWWSLHRETAADLDALISEVEALRAVAEAARPLINTAFQDIAMEITDYRSPLRRTLLDLATALREIPDESKRRKSC